MSTVRHRKNKTTVLLEFQRPKLTEKYLRRKIMQIHKISKKLKNIINEPLRKYKAKSKKTGSHLEK